MRTNPERDPGDAESSQPRKLTLDLYDKHAPGILAFLRGLPPRAETAFIRAVIYQWMLDHHDAEDYEERLLEVLNGPGGRPSFSIQGGTAKSKPARRPGLRQAPREQSEAVKPSAISLGNRSSASRSKDGAASAISGVSPSAVGNSAAHRPPGVNRVTAAVETPVSITIALEPMTPTQTSLVSEVGFLDDLLG